MPKNQLMTAWEVASRVPGGTRLFGKTIGLLAPYTSSIGARVEELRPGYARVLLPDRRAVRNHLRSIHAVAQMNVAELTGNLAMMAGMHPDARTIVVGFEIAYLKKARGDITAICQVDPPPTADRCQGESIVELHNPVGEVVSKATLRWLVGPKSSKHAS